MENEQLRSQQDVRAEYIGYASGLNLAFGGWLLFAPFVFGYGHATATWNSLIVGVLVIGFAVIRLEKPFSFPWLSWLNVVSGGWLVLSTALLGFSGLYAALWSVRKARNTRGTSLNQTGL